MSSSLTDEIDYFITNYSQFQKNPENSKNKNYEISDTIHPKTGNITSFSFVLTSVPDKEEVKVDIYDDKQYFFSSLDDFVDWFFDNFGVNCLTRTAIRHPLILPRFDEEKENELY